MVANGTMGLLDRRVMTRDLWATDHRLARQTAPFDLLLCCGKSVVDGRPVMAQSGAMGPLCDSSILL